MQGHNDSNPLLQLDDLPAFDRILPKHVEPAINQILQGNREQIVSLLKTAPDGEWEHCLGPIQALEDRLQRAWSPVAHLHAVADREQLRSAYNACLPKLTAYQTEIMQNPDLYHAVKQLSLSESPGFSKLTAARHRIVKNTLRDFRLAGMALGKKEQERLRQILQQLAQLNCRFEENLLDSTNAWHKYLPNANRLTGLSLSTLQLLRQNCASRLNRDGWMLSLDPPCYLMVMRHAKDRALREEMYRAYTTRASAQAAEPRWDNSSVMEQILRLRAQLAKLLGFPSFAHYALERRMARKPAEVLDLLHSLSARARPLAQQEFSELSDFARSEYGANEIQSWDLPYYSERLREQRFQLSQEELRGYFPLPHVLQGMFGVIERLYGIRVQTLRAPPSAWHADVVFCRLNDRDGQERGCLYLDLYARPEKRGGAWMDECRNRSRQGDQLQLPAAFLNCNFAPPLADQPSLLTMQEVETLFHEFGHCLHHLLTEVDEPGVAGINGVPWDAIEFPSQFMENWCWEPQVLDLIAAHHKTGAMLPPELKQRLCASRRFHSGLFLVRQLEFSLFDFELHLLEHGPDQREIQALLDRIRKQIAALAVPDYNRFQHSFSHIFAGGYAAGYYGYLWAEVLAADAYARFSEEGIFNAETGADFLRTVLSRGGVDEPLELFKQFRGQEPSIDPLLRQAGLDTPEPAGSIIRRT